jgi:hypothetical protein
MSLHDCERLLTRQRLQAAFGPSRGSEIAAVMIPTLQFKVLSQFDFIKQGGLLTENSNLQRSLKSLTLSWDLRRRVPSITDRLTVATLYAQPIKPSDAKTTDTSQVSDPGASNGNNGPQGGPYLSSGYRLDRRLESQSDVIMAQQQRIDDLERRLLSLENAIAIQTQGVAQK